MTNVRLQRLASSYQGALSELLITQVSIPELKDVTISYVRFSPDLKLATIYFRFLNGDRSKEVETSRAFKKAKGFLKRELAKKVPMKFTPELRFFYDDTFEYQCNIDSIFEQIKGSSHDSQSETD